SDVCSSDLVVSVGSLHNANPGVETMEIGVILSEDVKQPGAITLSNYSLNSGTITAARFVTNSSGINSLERGIVLTATGITPGNNYTLTVKGLSDLAGNVMPAPVDIQFTAGDWSWISIGRTTVEADGTPVTFYVSHPDAIATAPNGFNLISGGQAFWGFEDDITFIYKEVTGD